jgi:hypothetical protein
VAPRADHQWAGHLKFIVELERQVDGGLRQQVVRSDIACWLSFAVVFMR